MAEFTPGPWRVEIQEVELIGRRVKSAVISDADKTMTIAIISANTEADTHLVKASQEMYAVLKGMEGEARHVLESNGEMPPSVMNRARAIVECVERVEGKR